MVRAFYGCKTDEELVERFGYSLELQVEAMRKAAEAWKAALEVPWKATHRHAEGGVYRYIGQIKIQINGLWYEAAEYDNAEGMRFARRADDFARRFATI